MMFFIILRFNRKEVIRIDRYILGRSMPTVVSFKGILDYIVPNNRLIMIKIQRPFDGE